MVVFIIFIHNYNKFAIFVSISISLWMSQSKNAPIDFKEEMLNKNT